MTKSIKQSVLKDLQLQFKTLKTGTLRKFTSNSPVKRAHISTDVCFMYSAVLSIMHPAKNKTRNFLNGGTGKIRNKFLC